VRLVGHKEIERSAKKTSQSSMRVIERCKSYEQCLGYKTPRGA